MWHPKLHPDVTPYSLMGSLKGALIERQAKRASSQLNH
jgi:hypothetical protein